MTTPQSIMLVLAFCFIQFQFLFLLGAIKDIESREKLVLNLLEQTHECLHKVLNIWQKIKDTAFKEKAE